MKDEEMLSDLEANKRDHKVEITDVAISKVPYIEYKGIPEDCYKTLQELARMVLILSKENNNCEETAITYSLDAPELVIDGEECMTVSYGDAHSVDPLQSTLANHLVVTARGCVVIILHNHPNRSKISLQDVSYLFRFASIKMIVAVTNTGSVNYIVKTDKYNRLGAMKLFYEALEQLKKAGNLKERQDATDKFLNNCYQYGMLFEMH